MSGQSGRWAEEMEIANDDDEKEEEKEEEGTPSNKRPKTSPKTSDSPKAVSGGQARGTRPSSSNSKERSKEKSDNSIYSQFSKQDKEKAQRLIFTSVESNYFELLKELLALGVDMGIKNEDKATPLWLAIEEDCSLEMVISLMTPSLIGTRYKQNLTPLHRAAMKGDHKLMLEMINKMRDKETPLPDIVQTSEDDQIEQVKVQRGKSGHADWNIVNKKNKYGWTALHYAVDGGCVNVLQVLLMERECDVAIATKLGQTAFHFAAKKGYLLCLKLLFAAAECTQSLNSFPPVDKNGWNVACHASAQDNCDVMKWLLDHMSNYGADVNLPNKKGSTPLLLACEYQKTKMVKFLLDQSDEVTQQTEDGKSVLHIAASHDSVEIVEMLLSQGFPIDVQDKYEETALHVAYKWGSTGVQRLLMEYGADDEIANNKQEKPKDVAYKKFNIPKEIASRGKAAIAKFVADLRKGKAKMPRCKLMILGEAGVGKTSLLSLLTGEKFNPDHHETEGVDTDFVRTSNICSVTWKKKAMEGDEEYKDVAAKQLAQILPDKEQPVKHKKKRANIPSHTELKQQFESLVKKYTTQKEPSAPPKPKSKQFNTSTHHQPLPVQHGQSSRFPHFLGYPVRDLPFQNISFIQPLQPHPPPVITPEAPHAPKPVPQPPPVSTPPIPAPTPTTRRETRKKDTTPPAQQPPPPPPQTTDPDVVQTEIMRRAVKLKKLKSSDGQINIPLKFSSFDFAGQKHYKPMHHCFLTSRAVYVVAFNVRHLLNDQRDKCIQELKFWVNSIHIYTDVNAKIVLVGTHRGPYPGVTGNNRLYQLTSEQEKMIYKVMKDNFDKECYALQISWFENDEMDDEIIAMVENSLRGDDSGANAIRNKLLKLGDQYPGNNDDLPTSYLRLEQKIFEERKQNTLISQKEVEGWAREFGIDDPAVALTFFHDIGTIIDPSKLPTIFVDKEKLSALKDTLLLSPQWLADVMKELMLIKRSDDRYDAKSLRRLQKEGIVDEKILSLLWVYQLKGKKETFQLISVFLQAYGLIVPVGQQEPQQYYVPSQLPSTSEKMKKPIATADCNKVHISFGHDDGFLPPFVLHHLMFKMYSDSKKGKDSDSPKDRKCCFSANESFIEPLCDCQWWVCQGDDIIEVWIRTKSTVRTILPAVQYLHQSLVTILKELKSVTYTLGPVAECVGCEEQNVLEYITYDANHQSTTANHLRCPNCAHLQSINITTAAIKSKAYKTSFTPFREEIKKFSEDVQKHLEKRFKKKDMKDNESWNDILFDWYEGNRQDPWPKVVSALESYDGSVDDTIKEIKKDKLFMCNHID